MNAEEELRRLAAGPGWDGPMLWGRDQDSSKYSAQIAETIGDVEANWTSPASTAAQEHLAALARTLSETSASGWWAPAASMDVCPGASAGYVKRLG